MGWPYAWSIVRRGFRQLGRQAAARAVATLIMTVSLALAGGSFGLQKALVGLSARLNQEIRLIVFLKPVPLDEAAGLATEVSTWPGVAEAGPVSSQEAAQRLRKLLGSQAEVVEGLSPEVLSPFLEVTLTREALARGEVDSIRERLAGLKQADEVAYARSMAEGLEWLAGRVRTAAQVLAFILVLACLFIIFATIRLAFLSQTEEIEMLKLLGAGPWFIRGPFLIQGAGQGLMAAVLSLVLILIAEKWLNLTVRGLALDLNLLGWDLVWQVLAAGAAAGLAGAWLALGRLTGE